jgi:hypothetical protein
MHETLFCTPEFVEPYARALGGRARSVTVTVRGSGPPRTMCVLQTRGRYGTRYMEMAPRGLFASPGWEDTLDTATVRSILNQVLGLRTRSMEWRVRFDHELLANCLISLGLSFQRHPVSVLDLSPGYDALFANFSATRRRQVRRARDAGVVARDARGPAEVAAYMDLHRRHFDAKGADPGWPPSFIENLAARSDVARLLVVECNGRIAAGSLFLRDGSSIFYAHGAYDRAYSNQYPTVAIFDTAIRWACDTSMPFLNFGASAGMPSLEQFKHSWGAELRDTWVFRWTNPLWLRLARAKEKLWSRALPGGRSLAASASLNP